MEKINNTGHKQYSGQEDDMYHHLAKKAPPITDATPIEIQFAEKFVERFLGLDIKNPIVDLNPILYTKISFPNPIKDGIKHKLYTGLIHKLVHLNSHLTVDEIFSWLYFLNEQFAEPPMEFRELQSLFNYVYQLTQKPDYSYKHGRLKSFHLQPNLKELLPKQKCKIMNQLNGSKKSNDSKEKIKNAKHFLLSQGMDITQKAVAEVSGLSLRTVHTHFNSDPIDLKELVAEKNSSWNEVRLSHSDLRNNLFNLSLGGSDPFKVDNINKDNKQQQNN